ncbi:DNA polymerase III subunit epsilon [Buchnera aphidicola (Cinara strobi)]|uniref:DNA polymerase III subunit epsilon n=1 Tax=Buchnera aphidicola (Cinara strobi) TaxID=1921549 RepID=A0A3B1E9F8_9GAMM|nr:DNA polymerase III subunit epsilon [Buchnera aphidicola (Cinara strobi)]
MNKFNNRQVVLDIETTGMNKYGCIYLNHKIIEIGIIEIIDRKYTGKYLHYYLNPERRIEPEAYKVHGISENFLLDKPFFSDIYVNIINFIKNSNIIVHNAVFDISFLNYEFSLLKNRIKKIKEFSTITDTLLLARKLFPGKKNSLDALCNRYKIINVNRNVHSALLDAKILMKIYLYMTSKQKKIKFNVKNNSFLQLDKKKITTPENSFKILYSSLQENIKHKKYMDMIKKKIF